MPQAIAMPDWTTALGWALVSFVPEGVLIALIAAGLLRSIRGWSPSARYGVALGAMALMTACPVVSVTRQLSRRVEPNPVADRQKPANVPVVRNLADGFEPRPIAIANPTPSGRIDWRGELEAKLPALVGIWLVGVGFLSLRLVVGLVEVAGLTRRRVEPLAEPTRAILDRLIERAGVRRGVRGFASPRVEVPTVVGWIWPTILIPTAHLARLTARQVEAILAHEVAHIRRFDYLVNLAQVAVEALLFFHPAVWWITRRVRVEREQCCDDAAVALVGGDRWLVARALVELEGARQTPRLGVAATGPGGSLQARVRRLILPTPTDPKARGAGWAGMALLAGTLAFVVVGARGGTLPAQDPPAATPGAIPIAGRVLDSNGSPVSGARVILYRREGPAPTPDRAVEEARSGTDGHFRLTTLPLGPEAAGGPKPARLMLIAAHPDRALGWKQVAPGLMVPTEIHLPPDPVNRTITVTGGDGKPLPGATVTIKGLGDPSSPWPQFRDGLDLLAADGPLVAITDAAGQARFQGIPRTRAVIAVTKAGCAETPCFDQQSAVRLTPAATLEGTLNDPAGQPLPGVLIRMTTGFMWAFEQTRTDDQGHYRLDGLRARGWDMSFSQPGQAADGSYKLWIDSPKFVVPTQSLTLEPNQHRTLDLQAQPAGVVRITVIEEGTNRPVPDVRVWGFDKETGSSARFDATTDDQGVVRFTTAPTHLDLSIVGPPAGTFVDQDRMDSVESAISFDFKGGEVARTLTLPRISGRLVAIKGTCVGPDGQPATGATVHAGSTSFQSATSSGLIHTRQVDPAGEFVLDDAAAGRVLGLIILDANGKLGAWMTTRLSEAGQPAAPLRLTLRPLVTAEAVLKDRRGKILSSHEFSVIPKIGSDFSFLRRQDVKSDKKGKIRVDGVLPGLTYHVQEQPKEFSNGLAKMSTEAFDSDLVLAPEGGK